MNTDLARFMMPAGEPDVGFHTGEVIAWDQAAGTNTIRVLGADVDNVQVVASGSVMVGVGDLVAIWRYKTTYFVMGRIAPVEQALTVRVDVNNVTGFTTGGSYADLSSGAGPSVSDVYIGPSRRCLVWISAGASATDDGYAAAHVAVTGDSNIAPPTGTSAFSEGAYIGSENTTTQTGGSASRMFLFTEADGLNQGMHTFTMKYLGVNSAGTTPTNNDCFFFHRVIVVMPL